MPHWGGGLTTFMGTSIYGWAEDFFSAWLFNEYVPKSSIEMVSTIHQSLEYSCFG